MKNNKQKNSSDKSNKTSVEEKLKEIGMTEQEVRDWLSYAGTPSNRCECGMCSADGMDIDDSSEPEFYSESNVEFYPANTPDEMQVLVNGVPMTGVQKVELCYDADKEYHVLKFEIVAPIII